MIAKIESDDEYGTNFNFSNDGQILISQETVKDSDQQQIKVRQRNGKVINHFDLKENFSIWSISSDAQTIFLSDGKTLEARNHKGELVYEIYKIDKDRQKELSINNLLVSPNDNLLIVNVSSKNESDAKSTIQILDKTGKKIHQEEIDFSDEELSAFSQDGKYFTSKNNKDNSITLWSILGQRLKTLKGHRDWIYDIQFSPDSKYTASISSDGTMRLWSLESDLVQSINNQTFQWTGNSQWSEDRHLFVSHVKGGTLQLHPMAISTDPQKIQTILSQTEGNVSWNMTDDAQTIVITSNKAQGSWSVDDSSWHSVQVWHPNSNQPKTIIPKSQNKAGYVESQLSPDGQMLLTTTWQDSETSSLRLWSIEGKLIETLLPEGSQLTNYSAVQWVNNGQNIVTIEKNKVKLWDNKGKLVTTLIDESDTSDQDSLSFQVTSNPKGDRLVTYLRKTGQYNDAVQLWDMQGKLIKTLIDQYNIAEDDYDSGVYIQFGANNSLILVSDYRKAKNAFDMKVQAWTKNGELVQWEENGKKTTTVIDVKNANPNTLPSARISGENREKVFTSETGASLKIWDFKDNLLSLSKELPTNIQKTPNFTSLSPDGKTLAIQSILDSKTIYLWDLSTEKLREKLFNGSSGNSDWSLDSQNFATGSKDGTVQIWNRESNSITELNNLGSAVQGLRFSADNSVLATADADQIVLYDLKKVDSWEKVLKESCDWMADYLKGDSKPTEEATAKEEAKNLCQKYGTN